MLPPHIRAIVGQVQKAVEQATSSANDRSKRSEEAQKEIASSINSLANDFKAYQAKRDETERKKSRRENLTIFSLIATAAVTLALAVIGWLQWGTLDKTDQTLKETLAANTVAQRAFVFADGVSIARNRPLYWDFSVEVENSGNTPTQSMEYLTISDKETPTDPEDVFVKTAKSPYDGAPTIPQRWPGAFVGPKAKIILRGSFTGLVESTITQMAERRENYYIRGVIHYRDTFANTPEHITKFCYAVIPFKSGTETRVNYDQCLYWNCVDEDCKADRERYDHDWRALNPKLDQSKK